MLLIFLVLFADSVEVLRIENQFNNVQIYNDRIYFAPFVGNAIFEFGDSGELKPISFSDDPNYRILGFQMTPFAIYLNNGNTIEKFYLASGKKEHVYTGGDISSFVVTPAEEIILADRSQQELIFLDFAREVRYRIFGVNCLDLSFSDNKVYVLGPGTILLIDEHGNTIEEKKVPERFSNIYVDDETIFLFSKNKKYFYRLNRAWQKVDFTSGISDISGSEQILLILDGQGNQLSIFDKAYIEQRN